MHFNLTNDLCFFDLEATGLNVVRDRIVQIAIIKYFADDRAPEELSMLINPGIPISEEAMNVHGITPQDVARKPLFAQVAQQIYDFIGKADLAGYNSARFDIPMLMEEFDRAGLEFSMDNRRSLDMQRIFYKMEPRTLKAALRYYCNEDLVDAHDALADVRATINVFKGQLERYADVDYEDGDGQVTPAPVQNDIQAVHDFCNDQRYLDATQKFKQDHNGVVVFSFGKYINQPAAKAMAEDRNYYNWIQNKEFSSQVKQIARRLLQEYEKEQSA